MSGMNYENAECCYVRLRSRVCCLYFKKYTCDVINYLSVRCLATLHWPVVCSTGVRAFFTLMTKPFTTLTASLHSMICENMHFTIRLVLLGIFFSNSVI